MENSPWREQIIPGVSVSARSLHSFSKEKKCCWEVDAIFIYLFIFLGGGGITAVICKPLAEQVSMKEQWCLSAISQSVGLFGSNDGGTQWKE